MANYILEGIYFYSGFSFFYALGRQGKMLGTVSEIKYIQRDELTHLALFQGHFPRNSQGKSELFTPELIDELRQMMQHGRRTRNRMGHSTITNNEIPGLYARNHRQLYQISVQ